MSRFANKILTKKQYGLSQGGLALTMGTSPATIRNWEQGRVKSPEVAVKLKELLEEKPELLSEFVKI